MLHSELLAELAACHRRDLEGESQAERLVQAALDAHARRSLRLALAGRLHALARVLEASAQPRLAAPDY